MTLIEIWAKQDKAKVPRWAIRQSAGWGVVRVICPYCGWGHDHTEENVGMVMPAPCEKGEKMYMIVDVITCVPVYSPTTPAAEERLAVVN